MDHPLPAIFESVSNSLVVVIFLVWEIEEFYMFLFCEKMTKIENYRKRKRKKSYEILDKSPKIIQK